MSLRFTITRNCVPSRTHNDSCKAAVYPDISRKDPKMQISEINRIRLELFCASFIVLFQELVLIRWLPGQVRVLAYFPNLILLSAFLGLGIGCLRAGKKSLLWLYPVSMLLLTASAVIGSKIIFTQESSSEELWLLYFDLPSDAMVVHGIKYPIILYFLLSCTAFISLGQIIAERLQAFKQHSSPLNGYCLDICGSIFGVIIFSIICYFKIFPLYWFICFLFLSLIFFFKQSKIYIYIAFMVAICLLVAVNERATFYSPYYAISYNNYDGGVTEIQVNGSLHQIAMKLKRSERLSTQYEIDVREAYHRPYRYLQKTPQKALVLGAGCGNDVSVMLDEGVEQIDVVEIDPVICGFGRYLHPDKPYLSPKVRLFNTDARQFIDNTKEKYDLIVFGTLDSMTRLSALSNVRLDNFVYTSQSIKAAKELLNQDGGIVLYFMTQKVNIHYKIITLLTNTFGNKPIVENVKPILFNHIYMSGQAFIEKVVDNNSSNLLKIEKNMPEKLDMPTDDWPYLYLVEKGVSSFYFFIIVSIMLITLLLISVASGEMRRSIFTGSGIDKQMFLFGFAFLLLETRCVTQMNLIWGVTWVTSSVVFGSILVTILLFTILSSVKPMAMRVSATLLIMSLLVIYFIPVTILFSENIFLKLVMSLFYVGAPIGLAANCFAVQFKKRDRADLAFGWNMLGAVAGGLTEYLTMLIGFKTLLLISIFIYLLSFMCGSEFDSDTSKKFSTVPTAVP